MNLVDLKKMLQTEPFFAEIGVDTAENGLWKDEKNRTISKVAMLKWSANLLKQQLSHTSAA